MHEGHDKQNVSLIQTFCGHIMNEVVFTKHNRALVHIRGHAQLYSHVFALQAAYQAHIKGYALNVKGEQIKRYHLQQMDGVKYEPTSYIFINGLHSYIWYLTNSYYWSSEHEIFVSSYLLNISVFSCISNESELSTFTGLLSDNFARLNMSHAVDNRITCNILTAISFHLADFQYHSVLLTYPSDDSVQLTTLFQTNLIKGSKSRTERTVEVYDTSKHTVYQDMKSFHADLISGASFQIEIQSVVSEGSKWN